MSLRAQGVMLTHANLLAVVAGQRAAIDQIGGAYGQRFTPEDTMISYLPLAHIFDRHAPPPPPPRAQDHFLFPLAYLPVPQHLGRHRTLMHASQRMCRRACSRDAVLPGAREGLQHC